MKTFSDISLIGGEKRKTQQQKKNHQKLEIPLVPLYETVHSS